jgi:hypothetical protein
MIAASRRSLVLLFALSWGLFAAKDGFGFGDDLNGLLVVAQSETPSTLAPQQTSETKEDATEQPLPDIPTLMRSVEANQKAAEAVEKNYMYRSAQTLQELDGHGRVKKTETREYEVFWVNGVPVHRLIKKDGKELNPDELKKENDKIDKDAARAKEKRDKANEKGKETDPRGNELITVSRLLELGSFTNARRIRLNGRDTIVVDFTGDPKAKTRSRAEEVIRDLAGTAWVDETDRMLVKTQGHVLKTFKIGGGVVADIQKGTSFAMEQRKVNNEVWLPAMIEGHGAARALLVFSFNGTIRAVESDYRKFKATSTILPGISTVQPKTDPQ